MPTVSFNSKAEAEKRRKVAVVLVDRANYGRLKPVMRAIQCHPRLKLQVVAGGTMVLERFGSPVRQVSADGFPVDGEIFVELEGSTPVSMAKSTGVAVIEFAGEFQRLKPDIVLIIGDRFEALAATIAAAYMNLCIAHIQGGEVSGSIDEHARHAITKFAHFHLPATQRSAEFLVRMGESPESILSVGCPSSDLARALDRNLAPEIVNSQGGGAFIDVGRSYLLVVFHPTTTRFGGEWAEMRELLQALQKLEHPTLFLWPNIDAGADHISKALRVFRDRNSPSWLRTITNLPPEDYLKVLASAACAVGNSSSFVRDAGFFGTPVVLVGNRQDGREADVHVQRVPASAGEIAQAVTEALKHGRFSPSRLYGDGRVSPRLADALARVEPYVQKRLNYLAPASMGIQEWNQDSILQPMESGSGSSSSPSGIRRYATKDA